MSIRSDRNDRPPREALILRSAATPGWSDNLKSEFVKFHGRLAEMDEKMGVAYYVRQR